MVFGNMDDIGGGGNAHYATGENGGRVQMQQQMDVGVNDGIGDLEFNGDFYNPTSLEPGQVLSGDFNYNQQQNMAVRSDKARGNSADNLEVHRMRANSLALPGLLLDGANPDEQMSFGRWMDKNIAGGAPPVPHAMQIVQDAASAQQQRAPNHVAGANGKSRFNLSQPPQVSSECNVLMASKSKAKKYSGSLAATGTSSQGNKKPKAKKEKTKKASVPKKDKKEPRERKSQSKMKDMMESITSSSNVDATSAKDNDVEEKEAPASGQGRPRSMSDPNLSVRLDDHGLLHVDGPEGWVGAYSPDSRQLRIDRFMEKRNHRVWVKKVKYDVRKNFADSRLRVKGRFVKKEDEMLMRELMSLT